MVSLEVADIVEYTGVQPVEGETTREYVRRVGTHAGIQDHVLERVISVLERRRFATEPSISPVEREALARFESSLRESSFESVNVEGQGPSDSRANPHADRPPRSGQVTGYGGIDRFERHERSARPGHMGRTRRERREGPTRDTSKGTRPVRDTDHDARSSYQATRRTLRRALVTAPQRMSNRVPRSQVRLTFCLVLLVTLAPLIAGAANYDPPAPSGNQTALTNATNESITFFSVQGGETGFGAGLFAVNTDTKEVIWSHTEYFRKYFDVDPLSETEILFIAQVNSSGDSFRAIRMNWQTEEIISSFTIPHDTHDLDYVGNGTYVIADKTHNRTHGHRIYEYRPADDTVVWEFRFPEHFPPTAGDGIENDYTHLNDVDPVNNGSAYLASPRNFDRVFLINRSNKEVMWQLGEEDNSSILDEQHNPTLLQVDPPVVLVADSHNNRVVEYKLVNGQWRQTWEYDNWPWTGWARDADRLPNGNTLIVGSGRSRLLEVTPEKEIVWKMDISDWAQGPYDIERLEYGDEPAGPPIESVNPGAVETTDRRKTPFDEYYFLAQWLLPPWVSELLFVDLHLVVLSALGWMTMEVWWWRQS